MYKSNPWSRYIVETFEAYRNSVMCNTNLLSSLLDLFFKSNFWISFNARAMRVSSVHLKVVDRPVGSCSPSLQCQQWLMREILAYTISYEPLKLLTVSLSHCWQEIKFAELQISISPWTHITFSESWVHLFVNFKLIY